ncbi:MAG: hypothetical protein AAF443_04435 [Chlamydiota bacterium]
MILKKIILSFLLLSLSPIYAQDIDDNKVNQQNAFDSYQSIEPELNDQNVLQNPAIQLLKSELERISLAVTQLQATCNDQEAINDLIALSNRIDQLQQSISIHDQKIDQHFSAITALTKQVLNIGQLLSDQSALQNSTIQSLKSELERISLAVAQLQATCNDQEKINDLIALSNRIDQLQQSISIHDQKIDQHFSAITALTKQVLNIDQLLSNQNALQNSTTQSLKRELEHISLAITQLQQNTATYDQRTDQLEQRISNIEQTLQSQGDLQTTTICSLQSELHLISQEISALQSICSDQDILYTLTTLSSRIHQLQEAISDQKQEANQSNAEIEQLKHRISNVEQALQLSQIDQLSIHQEETLFSLSKMERNNNHIIVRKIDLNKHLSSCQIPLSLTNYDCNTVLITCCDKKMYHFDHNGNFLGKVDQQKLTTQTPAIKCNHDYKLIRDPLSLTCLDENDAEVWCYSILAPTPAIMDNSQYTYVGSKDGYFRCLDPNGECAWRFKTKGEITLAPVMTSSKTVFFLSNDFTLYRAYERSWLGKVLPCYFD